MCVVCVDVGGVMSFRLRTSTNGHVQGEATVLRLRICLSCKHKNYTSYIYHTTYIKCTRKRKMLKVVLYQGANITILPGISILLQPQLDTSCFVACWRRHLACL